MLSNRCSSVLRPDDAAQVESFSVKLPAAPVQDKSFRVVEMLEKLLANQSGIQDTLHQHQQALLQNQQSLLQKIDEKLEAQAAAAAASARGVREEFATIETELAQINQQERDVKNEVAKVGQELGQELAQINNAEHQVKQDIARLGKDLAQKNPGPVAMQMPEQNGVNQDYVELQRPRPFTRRLVDSKYFECAMAVVICINFLSMFTSLQQKGLKLGYDLGVTDNDGNWGEDQKQYDQLEYILNGVYVLELTLRMYVYGRQFFMQLSNLLDTFIVASSCIDVFIFSAADIKVVNLSVLKLTRLSRVLRLGKVLRSSPVFSELRVLIRTLCIAVQGTIWSVCLLTFIIIIGGILMAQIVEPFITSASVSQERKFWLYKHFGTVWAAMYTVFECSFTGGWVNYSRPLIEDVSYVFACFWVPWVILVNFTTMRVVGALFLKETMAVCARDAENSAVNNLQNKKASAEVLHNIFKCSDTSGDGAISQSEFDEMIRSDSVLQHFTSMGLDIDQVNAFFTVLAVDDGAADYEEFITGALALASSAPTLDRLKALQNHLDLEHTVNVNLRLVQEIHQKLYEGDGARPAVT